MKRGWARELPARILNSGLFGRTGLTRAGLPRRTKAELSAEEKVALTGHVELIWPKECKLGQPWPGPRGAV